MQHDAPSLSLQMVSKLGKGERAYSSVLPARAAHQHNTWQKRAFSVWKRSGGAVTKIISIVVHPPSNQLYSYSDDGAAFRRAPLDFPNSLSNEWRKVMVVEEVMYLSAIHAPVKQGRDYKYGHTIQCENVGSSFNSSLIFWEGWLPSNSVGSAENEDGRNMRWE